MKQANFGFYGKVGKEFGGSLLIEKRKTARPLSTKNPIHLVLKSSGNNHFLPGNFPIENLIRKQAEKYNVKIQRLSLAWSHVHMIIHFKDREFYKAFIRTVTAKLMRYFSQKLKKNLKGLFDLRPYTRILSWGRDLQNVFDYHDKNDMEARGMCSRSKKKKTRKRTNPR
jgi:REP element-mobilizing transposase RayT